MFEVLTNHQQVRELPARDILSWACNHWWKTDWREGSGATPVILFEPAPLKEESTFIFIDTAGAFHRAGSIEMAIRQAIWDEINSTGKPFLKEFIPGNGHSLTLKINSRR